MSTRTLRRLGAALLLPVVLALSACGAKIDITVHDNDTIDQTILLWDSGGALTEADCSAEGMNGVAGPVASSKNLTYTFTEHNGDPACEISTKGRSFSDFNNSDSNGASITHEDGKYDLTLPLDTTGVSTLGSLSGWEASTTVTFPGKVEKASGNATIKDNTVTWSNILDEKEDLHAVAEDSSGPPWPWIIAGIIAVMAVIAVGIIIGLVVRAKKRSGAQDGIYGRPQQPAMPQADHNQPQGPYPYQPGYQQPGQPGYYNGQPDYQQPYNPNGQY